MSCFQCLGTPCMTFSANTWYNTWQCDMTSHMTQDNEKLHKTFWCNTRYFLVQMWDMTLRQHVIPVFNCRAPQHIVCHVTLSCHADYHIVLWCLISYAASSAGHRATRFYRKLSCRIFHCHRSNKVQRHIEGSEIQRCKWPAYGRMDTFVLPLPQA